MCTTLSSHYCCWSCLQCCIETTSRCFKLQVHMQLHATMLQYAHNAHTCTMCKYEHNRDFASENEQMTRPRSSIDQFGLIQEAEQTQTNYRVHPQTNWSLGGSHLHGTQQADGLDLVYSGSNPVLHLKCRLFESVIEIIAQ